MLGVTGEIISTYYESLSVHKNKKNVVVTNSKQKIHTITDTDRLYLQKKKIIIKEMNEYRE